MSDRFRPTYDFELTGLADDTGSRGRVFRALARASRVLDVGCDTGRFGEALRREKGCEVHGIERDTAAAREAATRLHQVYERAIETERAFEGLGGFDAVLFLDVLEHLYDPWVALRGALGVLRPGGALYAVVPNIAHVSVVRRLLLGRFDYEQHGTMDRTHVRWFTRKSFAQALGDAGLVDVDVSVIPVVPWVQELPAVGTAAAAQLASWMPDQFGGSLIGVGRRAGAGSESGPSAPP
jgi:2-polyprenyl-3-methyl-5-hydroxy-6-metoxy-1,4-benzoquinol methylase